jgi:hypothetical protein
LTIDSTAPNNGEVSADLSGANPAGWGWIELFAKSDITINGDTVANSPFAVHANENLKTNAHGGFIRAASTAGSVIASGRDFQTNAIANGSIGGRPGPFPLAGCATAPCGGIVIEGFTNVNLTGGTSESRGPVLGGQIDVRAFNGLIVATATSKLDVDQGPNGVVNLNSCTGPAGNNFPPGVVVPLGALAANNTGVCGGAPTLPPYVAFYVNGQPQNPIVNPGLPVCPAFCGPGGACQCVSSFSLMGVGNNTLHLVGLTLETVTEVRLSTASCDTTTGTVVPDPPFTKAGAPPSTTIDVTLTLVPAGTYHVITVSPTNVCCTIATFTK